jgi:Zn-dependent protease
VLIDPPRSHYDVHFTLFGVPVRIHPWFWVVSFLLGFQPGEGSAALLIWILVLFVSLLVHEMGHALAIRHFGWKPRITLYQLGGLAIYDPSESYDYSYNPNQDRPLVKILIAAAGPAAGFLFCGLVVGLTWLVQKPITFSFGGDLGIEWNVSAFPSDKTKILLWDLIFINLFWGLVNLLPVFPLDGGQICMQLLESRRQEEGAIQALWISVFTGAAVAVLALARLGFDRNGIFVALMFGLLALQSYLFLQRMRASGYGDYRSDRDW